MLLRNKKRGQVAETVTWLVATIVILVILSIAIYTASALSKTNRAVTVSADDSPILLKKSLYGYLLTEEGGKNVFSKLEEIGSLDTSSKELGKRVFKDPTGILKFSLGINEEIISGKADEKMKINEDTTLEIRVSYDN